MENKRKVILIGSIGIVILLAIIICVLILNKNSKTNETNSDIEESVFELLYKDDENFYYADEKGKIYIFKGYNKIDEFINDITVASKLVDGKNEYSIINKSGKEIVKSGEYDFIERLSDTDYYKIEKNDKYGVVDSKGKSVLPIEYDRISIYNSINIFEVEKDGKYYYLSENGNMISETEKPSYGNTITFYKRINEEYDYLVKIAKNYYNARTGELVFSDKNSITFEYNILFENKKISLYDKELKLKTEIEDQDISSIQIYKTDSNHIVIVEKIKKDKSTYTKYRIYDENLNLKKESKSTDVNTITFKQVNEEYFYITEKEPISGNEAKYTTTLYDKNLKEYIRESSNAQYASINTNGDIAFVERDYNTDIVYLYDVNGKELVNTKDRSIETNYILGDYVSLTNKKNVPKTYDIYDLKGELIVEGVTDKTALSNKIISLKRQNNENSVIFENGNEVINKDYYFSMSGNSVIANNNSEKQVKIYDKLGNLKKEFSNIQQIITCKDKYLLLKNDSKYIVYDTKNNKQVYEFNISSFKKQYSTEGLYIIELGDAFYSFDGKKILDKKSK